MCILFIAIKQHPEYPLIIAANRDEFFNRPTLPSHFWQDAPHLLAGKDLQAGGSWMGVNRTGYLAALTNVRDPMRIDPDATSRGELVTNYLREPVSDAGYEATLRRTAQQYNGYNLLFGHWQSLHVYNNHQDSFHALKKGVYGLSNADLNSAWPKVNRGMDALRDYCANSQNLNHDTLFRLLRDDTQADDQFLPKTGVPIEWERKLSSIFIVGHEYGTRTSTVMTIDHKQKLDWHERTFDQSARVIGEQRFDFALD